MNNWHPQYPTSGSGYDRPSDLARRLAAAGFAAEGKALMAAGISAAALPAGVRLLPVTARPPPGCSSTFTSESPARITPAARVFARAAAGLA